MRRLTNIATLLRQTIGYSIATRRWSLILVVLIGFLATMLVIASQILAPLAVYPFV